MTSEPAPHGNASIQSNQAIPNEPSDQGGAKTVKIENVKDQEARHKIEAKDADSERKKKEIIFVYLLVIYTISFIAAIGVWIWGPDAAAKQNGFSAFLSILTGSGGYLLGVKDKK